MKCPTCQAVLLPVDGELFCLQCGEAYPAQGETSVASERPDMSTTTDPLLQKAINDGNTHPVAFAKVQEAAPVAKRSGFASMRQIMGGAAPSVSGAALVMGRAQLAEEPLRPVAPAPAPERIATPPVGPAQALTPVQAVVAAQPAPAAPLAPVSPKPAAPALAGLPHQESVRLGMWSGGLAWGIGLAACAAFILVNLGIARWYDGRVFPGVRVANLAVGGAGETLLEDQLRLVEASGSVTVRSGSLSQSVAMAEVGTLDIARVKQDAMAVGRTSALPIVGVVQAWYSAPVSLHFSINEPKLQAQVERIARQTQRPARNAQLAIIGNKAVVLREQTGQQINTAALEEAIRKALASGGNVTVAVKSVPADVAAVGLAGKLEQARRLMSSGVTLTLGDARYTPSPEQIGSWLSTTGEAVLVNRLAVGAYVNGLPGRFDRVVASQQLADAIGAGGAPAEIALGGRQKPAEALVPPAANFAYTYCLAAPTPELEAQLRSSTLRTLGDKGAWGLGGRLVFKETDANCDWHIAILSEAGMKQLAPDCVGQSTCASDGYIGLALESWLTVPKTWQGSQEAYRAELINHEVGHVLGFDHPACGKSEAKPVLSEPDIVHASGCSPEWYALPADSATSTIRAGF